MREKTQKNLPKAESVLLCFLFNWRPAGIGDDIKLPFRNGNWKE